MEHLLCPCLLCPSELHQAQGRLPSRLRGGQRDGADRCDGNSVETVELSIEMQLCVEMGILVSLMQVFLAQEQLQGQGLCDFSHSLAPVFSPCQAASSSARQEPAAAKIGSETWSILKTLSCGTLLLALPVSTDSRSFSPQTERVLNRTA